MKPRWIQIFIYSSGVILLVAALDRFLIGSEYVHNLWLPDPIFGIQLRYAAMLVAGIELIVAVLCLFGRPVDFAIGCLACLATNWAVYRIGLLWLHAQAQDSCLGSLTDPFRLSHGAIGFIVKFIPYYLLLGSYAAVILLWLGAKKAGEPQPITIMHGGNRSNSAVFARFLKISCSACGGHIEFPTNVFGQQIPCPHCQTIITLQKTSSLKMTCIACDGHVEFPARAIGQIIPCPHCNLDITLKEPA